MNKYQTNRDYVLRDQVFIPRLDYNRYSLDSLSNSIPKIKYESLRLSDMKMSYEKKK